MSNYPTKAKMNQARRMLRNYGKPRPFRPTSDTPANALHEVTLDGDAFAVDVDGTVHQPRRVAGTVLDEVRLAASTEFLRRDLTPPQRRYWTAVASVNPPNERLAFKDTGARA